MKFTELKKHLSAEKPKSCYYCYGDDDFLVNGAVDRIAELAVEPLPFNLADKEFDSAKSLFDELMQLPFMGEYRIVVVRGKVDLSAVVEYLKRPNPSAVLVIPYYTPHDSWNKAPTVAVPEGAIGVDCNRLPFKDASLFIRAYAMRTKTTISDNAADFLYRRCGGYMTRLNCETQKLALYRAGGEITEADIIELVEPDTEFAVFELGGCILNGNASRALEIVDGMAKNNDLVAAFTLLYNRFRKIFAAAVDPDGLVGLSVMPFQIPQFKAESVKFSKSRLKTILEMLAQADYDYKTGATDIYDALTSFVAQASQKTDR